MIIAGLIFSPPNPQKRFQSFAKVHLPEDTEDLRYHFSGGGLADYTDTYYFQTTPKEIDRLISEMNLSEGNRGGTPVQKG